MREPLNDKKRLEHILEAIDRLQVHAGKLSREELLCAVHNVPVPLCKILPKNRRRYSGVGISCSGFRG